MFNPLLTARILHTTWPLPVIITSGMFNFLHHRAGLWVVLHFGCSEGGFQMKGELGFRSPRPWDQNVCGPNSKGIYGPTSNSPKNRIPSYGMVYANNSAKTQKIEKLSPFDLWSLVVSFVPGSCHPDLLWLICHIMEKNTALAFFRKTDCFFSRFGKFRSPFG